MSEKADAFNAAKGSSPEYAMASIQDTTGFETRACSQKGSLGNWETQMFPYVKTVRRIPAGCQTFLG